MPALGNSLQSALDLQEPVGIDGPFPDLMRNARVGDLIQLQIYSVPGPGPSPEAVGVWSQNGDIVLVDAVTTGGAVYRPRPGQTVTGVIGTTNYSVFVKATRPGYDTVTVEVQFDDGSCKQVPFSFAIS